MRPSVSSVDLPTRPGIPPIAAHPMPVREDLPVNVVDWRPDPRRAVLLVHDMQRYFVHRFPDRSSPGRELVANAARLREHCAALGVPVCYTMQPGSMTGPQRGLLRDFWGPGMTGASGDRDVVDELAPRTSDWILPKWRYSAFHRTALLTRLRTAGRDQLIVCGVYAHIGVLLTACDAFSLDIQPFIAADAVADFSAAHHRFALDYAARLCAVVRTTADLTDQLGAGA